MDVHGFLSVDEHPSRATHSKVILHEGEDLMSIHAGAESWLGHFKTGFSAKVIVGTSFLRLDGGRMTVGRTAAPENLLEKFMSKNLCYYFGFVKTCLLFPP